VTDQTDPPRRDEDAGADDPEPYSERPTDEGSPWEEEQPDPSRVSVVNEPSGQEDEYRWHTGTQRPHGMPDAVEFVDEIPKTAAGKFRKTALRERFAAAS